MALSRPTAWLHVSRIKAIARIYRFYIRSGNLRMALGQLVRHITGRAFAVDKASAALDGRTYRQLWGAAQSLSPDPFICIYERLRQIVNDHADRITRTMINTRVEGLSVADCCRMISLPNADGRLLYQMVRRHGSKRILELGGAFGIGTRYLAMVLRDNDHAAGATPPTGVVVSLEIDAWRCEIAREALGDLEPYVRIIAASC